MVMVWVCLSDGWLFPFGWLFLFLISRLHFVTVEFLRRWLFVTRDGDWVDYFAVRGSFAGKVAKGALLLEDDLFVTIACAKMAA
jgi:hypothetical protein